jgi:N-acetylmuramoyl-L-alanine amidase
MIIIENPSPNFDDRETAVSMLVLHYTGMKNGRAAIDWLCNPVSKVSSHYAVDDDGQIYRLVAEGKRAWHAGVSSWRGTSGLNNCTIGIEIVNPGHEWGYRKFPAVQMASVIALSADIMARHAIARVNVVGHSDIAPLRKLDPGELFDWQALADVGVGLAIPKVKNARGPTLKLGDTGEDVRRLQEQLIQVGYNPPLSGEMDATTTAILLAFQRHFRPGRVDGIADAETQAVLGMVLAAV